MIINDTKPPLTEAMLEHFGVKGMHWGVRRERTPQQKLRKAQKKMDRLDADLALSGYELRGWALNKINSKSVKKNPQYKYSKLKPEERKAVQQKATKKVRRSVILRGASEVSLIAGGSTAVAKSGNLSPATARQGAAVATFLLGSVGMMRMNQLRAIKEADRMDELRDEINRLEKEVKTSSKK